uniref:Uncharacterized protein n=1 Tax=Oryctolagus cuniculus TaxID=9986 RepID=A0A5F9DDX4_RABIT
MAMMAGNAACFQRGSLFWFAVITLSIGYCTVGASEGKRRTRKEACPNGFSVPLVLFQWLSSGRRASLMRALRSWARSLSPWWTVITPSCTTGKESCRNNTLVSLETLKACSCL